MKILITGGAGFIGSHICDALIARGDTVVVLDNLDPQIHAERRAPSYLNPKVELIVGDVRDSEIVAKALTDVDAVIYNAAAVGVGQSMYQVNHYVDVNCRGAAVFWEAVIKSKQLKKIVLASSMSIYGEGEYLDSNGKSVLAAARSGGQLASKNWEMLGINNQVLKPTATSESKILEPASVYAITKRDQEELFLTLGKAYNIPVIAFRYFNVIGSRQSLSNPYTGVAAIFCSRLMNQKPPLVFEDGQQLRDFVHVSDLVQANLLALDDTKLQSEVFNIGSGYPINILALGQQIAAALNSQIQPQLLNEARVGDIRHCFADISKAERMLAYKPKFKIQDSLAELIPWLASQQAQDRVDNCYQELKKLDLLQ